MDLESVSVQLVLEERNFSSCSSYSVIFVLIFLLLHLPAQDISQRHATSLNIAAYKGRRLCLSTSVLQTAIVY